MASLAVEMGNGDDYLQLPPVEEEDDDGSEDIQLELSDNALRQALLSTSLAEIIPRVGVRGSSDKSRLALAVAEVLKTVESPCGDGRDCPICLQDDGTAAWKETPCGHRFHGRCVEKWMQAKGSCPMCRRQVVTMPTAAATRIDPYARSVLERSVIFELYGQAVVDSSFMDEE